MNTLHIVYSHASFAKRGGRIALEEEYIDFQHDAENAKLCTVSFCALELSSYLGRTDPGIQCVFCSRISDNGLSISLEINSNDLSDGGFSFLVKKKNHLVIRGNDRNGLVNGTYEFLRMQGWNWLEPGADGEFAPENHEIIFPEKSKVFTPSFKYRAFYFEFPSQASLDFLMWMARNRMNVFGAFPDLRATAKKLGMYILSGGHIITKLLLPNLVMESGRPLIREHPDWYGTRADGKETTAANALQTQFCCSNSSLMDYIADELVRRLNTQWTGTDILEISGFDSWGNTCHCKKCAALSDTEKYLRFMSAIRERFDQCYQNGTLKQNPMLNTWAYEGTATIHPPEKIPSNMVRAHDNCITFVIRRCYRHSMGEHCSCKENNEYARVIQNWGNLSREMPLWVGEYYNVSRHEDLPLLFPENMISSMKFYHAAGARGITYMHTPIINWSMRGITQGLHAGLAWNINMDTNTFIADFLRLRYGKHASEAKKAYREVGQVSADIAEWRSWGASILTHFHFVADEGCPNGNLPTRHYKDNHDVIEHGHRFIACYRKAELILKKVWKQQWNEDVLFSKMQISNPDAWAKILQNRRNLRFLECDLRLLRYGIDVFSMMTACAEAYDAIQHRDAETLRSLSKKLDRLAEKMSLYTESVVFRAYIPHLETRSALDRSQCGVFVQALKKIIAELSQAETIKKPEKNKTEGNKMKQLFFICSLLCLSTGFLLYADEESFPTLSCSQNHENGLYQCNETVVFSIKTENQGKQWKTGKLRVALFQDHAEVLSEQEFDLKKEQPLEIRHTFRKPGFVSLNAVYFPESGKSHSYETFCGAGADPEMIRAGTPAPEDLISYWKKEYQKLNQQMPAQFKETPLSDSAQCKRFLITTDMGDGKHFYATLAIPKNGNTAFPLIVSVLPAGNWGHSCWEYPDAMRMTISVFTREFPNKKDFDDNYYYRGTENGREGYFYHDAILGVMRMLDYAQTRPEWDKKNLIAMGQSQGGGFALISAALCPRITAVIADVPALCDHNGPSVSRRGGWPINLVKRFPAFSSDARYFDAANFVSFIHCPVIMSTGFIDTLCIPSSVYAAYNNLKCEKKIFSDPLTGHGYGRKGKMFQMMPLEDFLKEQMARQTGK